MNYILPRKLNAKLRADFIGMLVQFLPNGYAMLMRPNKAETAVHGSHCLGDMAVRMRKVLARPHSRSQRPRSFWSAPRIATSGRVQQRKSAIHGLPVTLRMP